MFIISSRFWHSYFGFLHEIPGFIRHLGSGFTHRDVGLDDIYLDIINLVFHSYILALKDTATLVFHRQKMVLKDNC
ncbi:hypothetical protein KJ854_02315, partial [Patescibacteria group bacterium]|nr:hypothetical protein [Patescibacteria group bacterium]